MDLRRIFWQIWFWIWEATDVRNCQKRENLRKWLGEGAKGLLDRGSKDRNPVLHQCHPILHWRNRVLARRVRKAFAPCPNHLPALQKQFVNIFFVFPWEFCIEKWWGFLVIFFLVSVSHETKHENSSKNSGKIRSKIRGKIRDRNSKNSGNFRSPTFLA